MKTGLANLNTTSMEHLHTSPSKASFEHTIRDNVPVNNLAPIDSKLGKIVTNKTAYDAKFGHNKFHLTGAPEESTVNRFKAAAGQQSRLEEFDASINSYFSIGRKQSGGEIFLKKNRGS